MPGVRRRLFELLVGALRDPASFAGVPPEHLEAFLAMAEHHVVIGQLAAPFAAAGSGIPAAVTAARQRATVRHLQSLDALARAKSALDRAGVPWVVMKGPVLAAHWYRDPAARTYHDLDLLVDPAALAAAMDALTAAGFAERNHNWSGLRSLGLGEVTLASDDVTIDLHWHVVTFERDRRQLQFRTADLMRRRQPVQLGSVAATTFDDADTLGHVVLHTQGNGGRLLLQLRDVHTVAARVDWSVGLPRLGQFGLERGASAVLERTERVLGPVGPHGEAVAPSLGHRPWREANALADGAWNHLLPGALNPFPSALMAAAAPTALGTAGTLATRSTVAVRRRLGWPTITSPGGPLDLDADGGGAPERERYVRDVEAGVFGR